MFSAHARLLDESVAGILSQANRNAGAAELRIRAVWRSLDEDDLDAAATYTKRAAELTALALLADGTRRIYGFGRGRRPRDGRWLVLTVPIPETQRQLRHRLRTRLTGLGPGSPTSGLWISTDTGKLADVQAVIDDLGLARRAFAWTGPAGGIGDRTWAARRRVGTPARVLDLTKGRAVARPGGRPEHRYLRAAIDDIMRIPAHPTATDTHDADADGPGPGCGPSRS